jgi:hypothetical protein
LTEAAYMREAVARLLIGRVNPPVLAWISFIVCFRYNENRAFRNLKNPA